MRIVILLPSISPLSVQHLTDTGKRDIHDRIRALPLILFPMYALRAREPHIPRIAILLPIPFPHTFAYSSYVPSAPPSSSVLLPNLPSFVPATLRLESHDGKAKASL
jgi:hypothetical protein